MSEYRTDVFYTHLRQQGLTEEQIIKFRERQNKLGELGAISLTGYFIHEANNAFGPIVMKNEVGEPFMSWTPTEIARLRSILMNVRQGLDWFTSDGALSKQQIKDFLDFVEQKGDWDHNVVDEINQTFKKLIADVK